MPRSGGSSKRRSSARSEEEQGKAVKSATSKATKSTVPVGKSGKASQAVTQRRRSPKSEAMSPEEVGRLVEEVSREVIEGLGLSGLFEVGDVRDMVESVVQSMVDEGRRLSKESILKILSNRREEVYKYLAARVLRDNRDLTVEVAEFIVFRAPDIAGRIAPQLYPLVKSNPVAVDSLRHLWELYGKPTPLKCPICGFKALTPDLNCIVCGGAPSEEEVKKVNNFEEELKHAIRGWRRELVEEALLAGYVYYDGEVKPPSMAKPGGLGALITLNSREKMLLREHLARLAAGQAPASR